jgi:hypothetical protein
VNARTPPEGGETRKTATSESDVTPDRGEAFVKVSVNAPDHWKVVGLARRLGISENEALGAMVRLWAWLPEHASMGRLRSMTAQRLAMVMKLYDVDAVTLLLTMLDFSLLEQDGEGGLVVHDWTQQPHTGWYFREQSIRGAHGNHVRYGKVDLACALCVSPEWRSPEQGSPEQGSPDQDQDQEFSTEDFTKEKKLGALNLARGAPVGKVYADDDPERPF